jgi:hypothetical protein
MRVKSVVVQFEGIGRMGGTGKMSHFVWTKMQAEGGQQLTTIVPLKEAERAAGNGVFWWGVGNSLGKAVDQLAVQAGGTLPILFSMMRTTAQIKDAEPGMVFLWTEWEDRNGQIHAIPPHVLEWSRGAPGKKTHYALVCHSSIPLAIGDHGAFDPSRCRTYLGNRPADSIVTALLDGNLDGDHLPGTYHLGFRADLVRPWAVKLVRPRVVSPKAIRSWAKGTDWRAFVDSIRAQ